MHTHISYSGSIVEGGIDTLITVYLIAFCLGFLSLEHRMEP